MRTINQYVYVDTFSQCMKTGRPTKWERLRDTEVLKKISKNDGKKHEYYSVQAYRNATAIRDLVAGDPVDRETPSNGHDVEEHERTLREAEPDLMPDAQLHYCGLYFDFDCDPDKLNIGEDEALQRAQADAHKLAEWFRKVFDLNPAHVQVFYSGRKGFHVMVHPEPFGIYPHKHLTYICQRVALQLKDELVLDTLDTAVYTISRMWRVVNTRHPKSGRYKVEMTLDELASMTPAEIRELASTTRVEIENHAPFGSVIWPPEEYEDIDVDDVAKAWWREFVDLYDAYRSMQKLSPRRPITTPPGGDYPACVQDILDNGPKDGGPNRNRVLLPVAGFLSDAGLDQREAYSILEKWTNDFYPDGARIKQRLQNAKTVVTAAYRGQLHFSCRAIRANRGAGAKGRVACVGEDACPWIREAKDQEPVEVPLVHLAEATNGCYIDGKVRTPVHVSALAGNPWGVPIKGKMRCVPNPEQSMCQRCPNIDTGGKMSFTLTANDCAVLEIVNCPNTHRRNGLKRYCGIPNDCTAVSIEPEQRTNLQDSEIIPMVDYERIYTRDDEEENELGGKGSKHVQRRALFLGEGLEANKKYIIEASVLEDPRNQRICFLFDKLEPAQDDIDKFEMTPTLYNNLKLFQPEDGESIEEKLDKIHTDLEANVHQIGGRRDLSVAIDLAYHSVIGFDLMGMPVVKGWFELLIMGDSATGKALATTTVIPTPGGLRYAGDIQVGDELVGSDGKPTKVLGVYPQGVQGMRRVTFRDGTTATVSGNHLWGVCTINTERDGKPFKVMTTDEIRESGLWWRGRDQRPGRAQRTKKYWIPTVAPVELEQREELPLNPYVLGVLIGDGSLSSGNMLFTNPEEDIADYVAANLPGDDKLTRKDYKDHCPTWRITGGATRTMIAEMRLGCRAEDKFIPAPYLWSSIHNRTELLCGLCDTDGHVDYSGGIIDYVTVSERLAKDIVHLVQSLGGLARLTTKKPTYTHNGEKKEGQLAYRIGISVPPEIVPVSSEKHLARWKGRGARYHRNIVDICDTVAAEAVCFKVAAKDELFCTNDFIVTHNSTLMDRMMGHFGLGEMIAGEEAKRTGLVHNTTQLQKTWVLKWGKIPQNDRRLLVIDEFAGIDPDEVAKLTQLRSEGKARGSGVTSDHETWARTRLILLTNPKNNSAELAAYNYGIDAIRHLFKELQDTRRVDLALIAERSEVSTDMLNRRWDLVNEPHIYTSDICQKLVLWAWSREPKDVVWSVEAVERVRHWAEVLGDTYACDIPLAERADLKLKLARIAAATAARMFSTDAEGVKLFVNADHVDFVADFMDRAYRKPAMSYMEYARRWKAENLFTEKRRASIVEALNGFDDTDTLVAALLDENVFPKSKLRDTLDLETDEFDRLWKLMLRQRLLKSTARGYRKTPAFTKMLKAMKSRKSGYADDGRDPFDDSADTAPNYAEEAPF